MDKYEKLAEMVQETYEFAKKHNFALCVAAVDENDKGKTINARLGSAIDVIPLSYMLVKTTFDEAPDEVKGNLKKTLMKLTKFICDTEAELC